MTVYSDRDMIKLMVGLDERSEVADAELLRRLKSLQEKSPDDMFAKSMLFMDPMPKDSQIQPSSIDVYCDDVIYKSKNKVTFSRVDDRILKKYFERQKISDEYVLEPGETYIVQSGQKIKLRWSDQAISETKSSSGRVGLLSLAVGERYGVVESTDLPTKILGIVEPLAFPVKIKPNDTTLFQLRIRRAGTGPMSKDRLSQVYMQEDDPGAFLADPAKMVNIFRDGKSLPFDKASYENGIKLTLDTSRAFVSKDLEEAKKLPPIDMSKKSHYNAEDYFDVKTSRNGDFLMDANRFYLFGTRETVYMKDVCGRIEREDQEAGVGLFHHFAGFFDPYWGGGITLEMLTTMYKNRILTHGQSVGRVYFEDLSSPVMRQYGEKAGSHYKDQQAPRLAKFFKNFQTPVS